MEMGYKLIGRMKQNWKHICGYVLLSGGEIQQVSTKKAMELYEQGQIDDVRLANKVLRITYTNDKLLPVFDQDFNGKQGNSAVILRVLRNNRGIQGYTVLMPNGTKKNLQTSQIIDVLVRQMGIGFLNANVINDKITGVFHEYTYLTQVTRGNSETPKLGIGVNNENSDEVRVRGNTDISEDNLSRGKSTSIEENNTETHNKRGKKDSKLQEVTEPMVVDKPAEAVKSVEVSTPDKTVKPVATGKQKVNRVAPKVTSPIQVVNTLKSAVKVLKASNGVKYSTPKFPKILMEVPEYKSHWVANYDILMSTIKRDPKFISELPIFKEFPNLYNDTKLRFFRVEDYPSVVFETASDLYFKSKQYRNMDKQYTSAFGNDKLWDLSNTKLILHIVFSEDTPQQLFINPPIPCEQIVVGDSLVCDDVIPDADITVKASVVLDKAFEIGVRLNSITLCCGGNGYLGYRAFSGLHINRARIDVFQNLYIDTEAFYGSTIKKFDSGVSKSYYEIGSLFDTDIIGNVTFDNDDFKSNYDDTLQLSVIKWGKNTFTNCIYLKEFAWYGYMYKIPDRAFYNCIYLDSFIVDNLDTDVSVGVQSFGYDDNSDREIPENITDKQRTMLETYINHCKALRSNRTIRVLKNNPILDSLNINQDVILK